MENYMINQTHIYYTKETLNQENMMVKIYYMNMVKLNMMENLKMAFIMDMENYMKITYAIIQLMKVILKWENWKEKEYNII